MALNGIGGKGGNGGLSSYGEISALEKFQAIREQAKKKMDGTETRMRLADAVTQKQVELKKDINLVPPAAYVRAEAQGRAEAHGRAGGYGGSGAMEKPDLRPRLGQYIDFMA